MQSAAEKDRISEIKDKQAEMETEPKFANCCTFCPKSFKKPSDLIRYTPFAAFFSFYVCTDKWNLGPIYITAHTLTCTGVCCGLFLSALQCIFMCVEAIVNDTSFFFIFHIALHMAFLLVFLLRLHQATWHNAASVTRPIYKE